jgi:hypothetical protein
MIVYKLTDERVMTFGRCQWDLNVKKTTDGRGELCGAGWLHAYPDPLTAVFMNRIHANFGHPRLFEAEAGGLLKYDKKMKLGATELTLLRELELPVITPVVRVRVALKAVLESVGDVELPVWKWWAQHWLSGAARHEVPLDVAHISSLSFALSLDQMAAANDAVYAAWELAHFDANGSSLYTAHAAYGLDADLPRLIPAAVAAEAALNVQKS